MLPLFIAILVVFLTLLYKFNYKDPAIVALPNVAKLIPFFGHILSIDIANFRGTVVAFFEKTNEKIAVLYAFNRPVIFIADPTIGAALMRDGRTLRQGRAFRTFYSLIGKTLFSIDGPIWKERRTRLNPSFGPLKVRNFFPLISAKGIELINIILEQVEKEGFVDVDSLFVKASADVIMSFCLSKNYKVVSTDIHQINRYFQFLRDQGFQGAAIPYFYYLPFPSRIKFYFKRKQFNRFLDNEINEKIRFRQQKPGSPALDAADVLIDAGIALEDIRTELIGLIFAGHDTTAHTMAFTLHELTKEPNKKILDKLMQEIDSVIPTSSNGLSCLNQIEDVSKLVYLSAVLKETLRLYPIAMMHPRELQEDMEIAGYKLPKGTSVLVDYYTMQRLSKFWTNPMEFNPDRWLAHSTSSETEDFSPSSQLSQIYMPFLHGPHVCIGQHLAQLEMKVLLATLLKNLSFSPKPNFSMRASIRITLCPLPGVHLVATRR